MKKQTKVKIAAALSALFVAGLLLGRASTFIFIGAMTEVSSTTAFSPTNSVGTFNVPHGTFYVGHKGLAATNDLPIQIQVGIDTNYFITVYTWYPPTTNDTSTAADAFTPAFSPVTIYMRGKLTTTNDVFVGGSVSF